MGAYERNKGTGCNLSSKRGIPPSGNAGTTRWAATLRSEMVPGDEVPVTLDEKFPTVRATRVLPVTDHTWQIPGIDVPQASLLADLCCPHQRLGAGVLWIGHFVVFVKSRYMPRNIRPHACQKLGQPSQFVAGVVEPGNHQRNDFQPEAHLVQPSNGIQDGLQAPAELTITAVIKALQVHLVKIHPRS